MKRYDESWWYETYKSQIFCFGHFWVKPIPIFGRGWSTSCGLCHGQCPSSTAWPWFLWGGLSWGRGLDTLTIFSGFYLFSDYFFIDVWITWLDFCWIPLVESSVKKIEPIIDPLAFLLPNCAVKNIYDHINNIVNDFWMADGMVICHFPHQNRHRLCKLGRRSDSTSTVVFSRFGDRWTYLHPVFWQHWDLNARFLSPRGKTMSCLGKANKLSWGNSGLLATEPLKYVKVVKTITRGEWIT